jgi:hypothetical protein
MGRCGRGALYHPVVSKLLVAVALAMTLAQASGALALLDVDFCDASCAGESRDAGCPPTAECCACCAVPPSLRAERAAAPALSARETPLPEARGERPPLPDPVDVFHVPLRAAA